MSVSPQHLGAVSKMTSNISDINYGSLQPTVASGSLTAFHSSAQWRAHFNSSKLSTKLMVIDFTASWCAPCRLMEPMLKELASQHTDVEFIKIDVDRLMDVSQGFEIQLMPTFLLMKKGEVVDKVVGTKVEELKLKIEEHRGCH